MPTVTSYIEPLESRIAPATIVVTSNLDSGPGTLRAALALADDSAHPGHDTIVFHFTADDFSNGAVTIPVTSGQLTTHGNVTVTGPGAGLLILQGNASSRILSINPTSDLPDKPVVITGLSMIGGSDSEGGAIDDGIFSLTLNHVVISGCVATSAQGGAVEIAGSTNETKVHISNSFITGNTAASYGAGMNLNDLKSLTISNTVVTGNTATNATSVGGGINIGIGAKCTATITGCVIAGNNAAIGGGLYLENPGGGGKFNITNTVITGNKSNSTTANTGGGGIVLKYGRFAFTGCTVGNNTAVYDGGGLFANKVSGLTISNSNFSGNQTTNKNGTNQGGGGAFVYGNGSIPAQPVVISGSHFLNNRSAYSGGGLYAANGAKVTVSSSTFIGNHAATNGGGLFTSGGDSSLSVTVSTFADNVTIGSGGGIWAADDGGVSIVSSKLTGNIANIGGGARVNSYGVLSIKGDVIANNTGTTRGGGIETVSSNHFLISGGSITGNTSGTGGGVFCYDSSTGPMESGSIKGTIITGNFASNTGGGVLTGGTNEPAVTIQISKVFGNTAVNGDANTGGNITYA